MSIDWMTQLPALAVALPLIAAPLCAMTRSERFAWGIAQTVALLTTLISIALLWRVMQEGVIDYRMGGWAAPWGISYRIDAISAFVLLIVSGFSAVSLTAGKQLLPLEIDRDRMYLVYTAWMLLHTGLSGMVVTGDAFNLFVFLEVASLSSYTLVALGPDRRSLIAAFRYLILGTLGGTFFLIGVGLLYMMTGTLNMADLAERLPEAGRERMLFGACAFIITGLGLKAAMFPLHAWLPDAYARAPSVVTGFMAAASTKVSAYAVMRFLFTVFGGEYLFEQVPIADIILWLAAAGVIYGSIAAVFQRDVRRLLAWSSVAQVGYIMIGVGIASQASLTAGTLHLFNHALAKCTLFLALSCICAGGSSLFNSIEGLGKTRPIIAAVIVIAGLSLIGVPLTPGFISKWYLIQAAIEAGQLMVVFVIVAGSLLAVAYVWRMVEAMYFCEPGVAFETPEVARSNSLLLGALILLSVVIGVGSELPASIATAAAEGLLAPALPLNLEVAP